MAETLLSVVAEGMLKKVLLLASEEVCLVRGLKGELKRLSDRLETIQVLLADAESKQLTLKTVELWLRKLKAVSYGADAMLDEFQYELLRRTVENRKKDKVRAFLSPSRNPLSFRMNMSHKIRDINIKVDKIYNEAIQMGLKPIELIHNASIHREARETHPGMGDPDKVLGRDDDLVKIVDMLLQSSDKQRDLSVVTVVGMPGQGKTTLAKLVYKNEKVVSHFDERMWVCVSDDFEVKRILNETVQSLTQTNPLLSNMEGLFKELRKHLNGKRYLLVLDDVWNDIPEKWESIRDALLEACGSRESKVLVTTRSNVVASTMVSVTYPLGKLSDDASWTMFRQIAFADDEATETSNLVDIGREIVKKCSGLPLAIQVIAALMRSKKSKRCKMHDLVHDLAQATSENYILTIEADDVNYDGLDEVVHLSLISREEQVLGTSKVCFERLQSLILKGGRLDMTLTNFRCLRVLVLVNSAVEDLPDSIGTLKHLKYLDISKTSIKKLPDTFNKLYHLQTLRVKYLIELPKRFGNLINLRHFCFEINRLSRDCILTGLWHMTYLQTLPLFVVNHERGCHIEDLRGLSNLKGELKIYGLEDIRNTEEARKANLSGKANIRTLEFHWSSREKDNVLAEKDNVLEGLKPHPNLQGLTIKNFIGKNFGSWIMVLSESSIVLENLVEIVLKDCTDCEHVLILGHLPCLKVIKMEGMLGIKYIGSEFYGLHSDGGNRHSSVTPFPALEKMSLATLPSLEEWSEVANATPSMNVFPCLKELDILGCRRLKVVPSHFSVLERLKIDDLFDSRPLLMMNSKLISLSSLKISWVRGPGIQFVMENLLKNNKASLREITISDCPELSYLPVQMLVALKIISVRWCQNLTCIQGELSSLESIREFRVYGCQNLSGIPEGLETLASLGTLSICQVQNIRDFPDMLCHLTSLRKLEIQGFEEMTCLPMGLHTLVSLESLSICGCPKLRDIHRLTSLQNLEVLQISDCRSLVSPLPDLRCLTKLRISSLGPFATELDCFPWPYFNCSVLVRLLLNGWPGLMSLPEHLQHLAALKELSLWEFDGLEALPDWLGNLSSLQSLALISCRNLMYLPAREAMRRLTKLQLLEIRHCPLLKTRCGKGSGPEWCKIDHIPDIEFPPFLYRERHDGVS
ncbi:hypothetical protein RJ639_029669 [Escallonia herrerae]|uniref:Disease resistance protein RGA3 n=1 Tax=Escallonia herrerae TaxID=1293975 RepID=A0AA88WZQ7_9ASTE|nr:hypothetical protein RJ639_029669 [Escallonia herrerae]